MELRAFCAGRSGRGRGRTPEPGSAAGPKVRCPRDTVAGEGPSRRRVRRARPRLGHDVGRDPRGPRGHPAVHRDRAAVHARRRVAARARAAVRREARPKPARAVALARERGALVRHLVRGRLLVRAVHPVGPRRRPLRDVPAARRGVRALHPAGRAAEPRRGSRPPARVRRRRGDLLRRPASPRRRARARGGAADARLPSRLGGVPDPDQAVGEGYPSALARGRPDAHGRRRDGRGRPRLRARPGGRLRRGRRSARSSTSRSSARR